MKNRKEIAEKLLAIRNGYAASNDVEPYDVTDGYEALNDAIDFLKKEPLGIREGWPQNLLLEIGIACTEKELQTAEENLMTALDTLKEREKEILIFRYKDGLTLKEAGKRLGICEERIRSIAWRAVRSLKRKERLDIVVNGKDSINLYSRLKKDYEDEIERLQAEVSVLREKSLSDGDVSLTRLYAKDISHLGMSARSTNCLRRAGINRIGGLSGMSQYDLSRIRNAGAKAVSEITEAAHKVGIEID